jgi:hypothetical protein
LIEGHKYEPAHHHPRDAGRMTFAGPQSSAGFLKTFMCPRCKTPQPLTGRRSLGRNALGNTRYVCAGCAQQK